MCPRTPALRLPLVALLLVGCAHGDLSPERCAAAWAPQTTPPPADPTPLPEGDGRIDGVVRNHGGEPIVGARVELIQANAEGRAYTHTDENGHYIFREVPADSFQITVIVGLNDVSKTVTLPDGAMFRANFVHSSRSGRQVVDADELPEDALLRIRKSACLGACSAFAITVFEDGRWLWEKSTNTRVERERSGHLTPRRLDRLRGVQRCLVAVPEYDWARLIDRSTITLTFRDGANVVQLDSHNKERTPPQVRAAVKALGRDLPIRRFVGRSWRP